MSTRGRVSSLPTHPRNGPYNLASVVLNTSKGVQIFISATPSQSQAHTSTHPHRDFQAALQEVARLQGCKLSTWQALVLKITFHENFDTP